jgi:hypothetical protein
MNHLFPSTSPAITWEYLPLLDIEVTSGLVRPQARLLCEEDEGGWMSAVFCDDSHLFYLEPYAALLHDWRQDNTAVERPVIPIYRSEGRLYLSLSGAELDYPELREERQRRLAWDFRATSTLVNQIRKAAHTLALTSGSTTLSHFLKKST